MPDSIETIIAPQLLRRIQTDGGALYQVAIDVNTEHASLGAAYDRVTALLKQALENAGRTQQHILSVGDDTHPYIAARLEGKVILALGTLDAASSQPPGPVISGIRPASDGGRFSNPDNLVRGVIAIPMLRQLEADGDTAQDVMIEVNVNFAQGRTIAKQRVRERVQQAISETGGSLNDQFMSEWKFLHLLNYTTCYLMKARAGDVGIKGVAPLIVNLRGTRPDIRIHMIGHSSGCRLVAATINALPRQEQFRPDTAMLLQGALSHNGFALKGNADRGAFRDVIEATKVRGPILITHTRNDKVVGIAYPIASRISGVNAASLGDENDIFGAPGSNGAQTAGATPQRIVRTLLDVAQPYPFSNGVKPTTPCNLKADQFISGHGVYPNPGIEPTGSTSRTCKNHRFLLDRQPRGLTSPGPSAPRSAMSPKLYFGRTVYSASAGRSSSR